MGKSGGVYGLCGGRDCLLWSAFAGYEDTNAFDHLGGRAGALRQKDVGVESAIEGVDGAGDDHRREARMELFGPSNKLVAVHLRHQKIAENHVQRTGKRSIEDFEGLLGGIDWDDAVATGFQQESADREDLFVVVYAENRLLGAHAVSLLPEVTFWWLAADGPDWHVCWFAGAPV